MKTTPLGYSSGTGSIRKSNIKKGMEAECRHGRIEIKLEPRINAPDELKVFRILDKTFMFGTHYLKHFEAMSPKRNDHYAGGTFICDSEGEWAYRDEAVDFGNTYVYWMEKSCGTRIGPFPVKMRDPGIWWPYQTIYERMVEIAARHQGMVEFKSFGTSTGGRDIAGLIVGNRQRLVAVIGLIHAGESGPELMIPAVERLLIEDGDLLKKSGFRSCRMLTPTNGNAMPREFPTISGRMLTEST